MRRKEKKALEIRGAVVSREWLFKVFSLFIKVSCLQESKKNLFLSFYVLIFTSVCG